MGSGKRFIPAGTDCWQQGQLPGRRWVRGVDPRRSDLERVGSTEGRAGQVLGTTVLGIEMGTRVSRTD